MKTATITLHLPIHREQALCQLRDRTIAAQTYALRLPEYLRFLQTQAEIVGVRIVTDDGADADTAFAIDATEAQRQSIDEWLQQQPDIWTWAPAAD